MTCVYCGERATSIDHIRSISRGGPDIDANKVPCCQPCNSSKGDRLLTEWDTKRVMFGIGQDERVYRELLRLTLSFDTITKQNVGFLIMHIRINDSYVSLKEIADADIIPMTYSALRKAKARGGFPRPINGRYNKMEIIRWFNSRYSWPLKRKAK